MLLFIGISLLCLTAIKETDAQRQKPKCGHVISDRVVGGHTYATLRYPWLALLVKTTNYINCAGSLISSKHVLTAAHCFLDPMKLKTPLEEFYAVVFGVHNTCDDYEDRDFHSIRRVHVHSKFDEAARLADIALIVLKKPSKLPVVCLPPRGQPLIETAIVIGWGRLHGSNNVGPCCQNEAIVTWLNKTTCADLKMPEWITGDESLICAGGRTTGTCMGDSGGPFLTLNEDNQHVLSGITSFGFACGLEGKPDVYTRVEYYLDWIEERMVMKRDVDEDVLHDELDVSSFNVIAEGSERPDKQEL